MAMTLGASCPPPPTDSPLPDKYLGYTALCNRADVKYDTYRGRRLDRAMLELLRSL
jgi:hypothetical protein